MNCNSVGMKLLCTSKLPGGTIFAWMNEICDTRRHLATADTCRQRKARLNSHTAFYLKRIAVPDHQNNAETNNHPTAETRTIRPENMDTNEI